MVSSMCGKHMQRVTDDEGLCCVADTIQLQHVLQRSGPLACFPLQQAKCMTTCL